MDLVDVEAFASEIVESLKAAGGGASVALLPTKDENVAALREYIVSTLQSAADGMWLANAMIDGFEWSAESEKTALTTVMSRLAYWNEFQETSLKLLDQALVHV